MHLHRFCPAAGPTLEHPDPSRGLQGCFRNATPRSTKPNPSELWWTLVNRDKPGQSWITLINIRGSTGFIQSWQTLSRMFPGGPGAFQVISVAFRCFPGATPERKYRGDPGRTTKVLNVSKLFRASWGIQDAHSDPGSSRCRPGSIPGWPRFPPVRHLGSSGTAQTYSVTGALTPVHRPLTSLRHHLTLLCSPLAILLLL